MAKAITPSDVTFAGTQTKPLPKPSVRVGLSRVIQEGLASQSMEALTTGVFLVGIALQLGASNFLIGVLGAVPFLSNLCQIPAILLIEKYRNRRRIVATACLIGRSFLLVVALAPFIDNKHIALTVVVVAIILRYCIGSMATCAWNSWMRDLVPGRLLGRFFSRRLFYMQGIMMLLTLGAGFFIDWWQKHESGQMVFSYTILYSLGYLMAMVSTYMITTIPHPPMRKPEGEALGESFRLSHLKRPFKHQNFKKLMLFLVSWNFAINLSAPFFTVYMLKTLDFDMAFVVAMTLLSQFVNVMSLRVWGKYSDSYSNKTVLRICGTLFIFCIFGWTFTTFPEKHMLTVPLLIVLHICMGIATAGVLLTSTNIALKLAPRDKATSFLAVNTMMGSLAAGSAPLLGGMFADFFEDKVFSFDIRWQQLGMDDMFFTTLSISHWDFFFSLSFVLGLYSLRRLALVEEKGTVKGKVVMKEIVMDTGRILRSVSTVGGLRSLTLSPMAVMVNLVRKPDVKEK